MRMIAMIVFGRTPKAVESVGEVKDGAKLMVQRVDNILKGERNKSIKQRLHHNVKLGIDLMIWPIIESFTPSYSFTLNAYTLTDCLDIYTTAMWVR